MKLLKKIFNKLLFAFIVALVFAFINKCSVKAYYDAQLDSSNYTTNGDVISIQETSNLFVDVAYGGSSFSYGCENDTPYWDQVHVENPIYVGQNIPYCFYTLVNKNNSNSIAIGSNLKTAIGSMSGSKPTSQFLYYVKPDNYDFVSIQSVGDEQHIGVNMLIVFNGTAPILTNEGSSDNAPYRLTAQSSTDILYYRQGFNYNSSLGYDWSNYPWQYYIHVHLDSGEYMQFKYPGENNIAPLKRLYVYGSTGKDVYYSYASNTDITWNTKNDTEDEFPMDPELGPSGPSVEFESRDVKIGDITTSVELKTIFLEYSDSYKYYYQYVPLGEIPDDDNWTRLYYENITHTEYSDYLPMLFDENGVFYVEIYEPDEPLGGPSIGGGIYEINNIMKKSPEIEFSVDFNSSNTLTIDEVLVNIDYLIYGKERGWNNGEYVEFDYICQYAFLNDNESLDENTTWTTTDCGGHLYVSHINGRVAARIVIDDNGYQDVALNTYIIDKVGTLVSDMYDTTPSNNNFFGAYINNNGLTGLFNSSSGPIKNIVALPLRVGTFIYQFFNMPSVCSPYDMGTIFGHHLIIGCVDLSILGSPLLTTIDIIFAGAFTITWLLFLYKLFRKIVLLRNLNVEDMVKGGIF